MAEKPQVMLPTDISSIVSGTFHLQQSHTTILTGDSELEIPSSQPVPSIVASAEFSSLATNNQSLTLKKYSLHSEQIQKLHPEISANALKPHWTRPSLPRKVEDNAQYFVP